MRLNKREKILITVLFTLLAAYLFYAFLFSQVFNAVSSASKTIGEKRDLISQLESEISELSQTSYDDGPLLADIKEKGSPLFPVLKNNELVRYIASVASETGLKITRIDVEELRYIDMKSGKQSEEQGPVTYTAALIAENVRLLKDAENIDEAKIANVNPLSSLSVETVQTLVNFENTTYQQLMAFFKRIEGLKKYVLIDKIDIDESAQNNILHGTVVMTFYAVKKLEPETSPLEFVPAPAAGKYNPFS